MRFYKVNDNGIPFNKRKNDNQEQFIYTASTFKEKSSTSNPCEKTFHYELVFSLKPITCLMIVCISMIEDAITVICVTTSVFGVYFILIVTNTILLFQFYRKR